jgi:hypothetical protein
MIFEGNKPNYSEVIVNAETDKILVCKHDFWDQAKLMEFGDIILCQRCSQYFTKIKHMLWLVRSKDIPADLLPPHVKGRTKPVANHKDWLCMVRVPVRITDDKD